MAAFTLCAVLILWLTQSLLLGPLFRFVKTGEMKRSADEILSVTDGDYSGLCEEYGTKYNLCLSVYVLEDGGRQAATWHSSINPFCFIHGYISDSFVFDVLKNTGEDGNFLKRVELKKPQGAPDSDEGESILYARASHGVLVIVNGHISPLSTTVATLRIMTVFITVLLVVISAILSYFISKKLAKPLVSMRDSARKFAAGEPDIRFDGGGSRETAELADTLNMASHELSETDRIRRDLIANVSHDLRTPLTLISGYAEVMRDIPGEMTRENMEIIVDETKMLSSLVNDMLEASKLTDGAVKIVKAPFDLSEAARETVERYSKLKETEGYDVVLDAEDGIAVCADRTRILQVIYNLMNNAVNYTGDDKRVVLSVKRAGANARVEVTDTGAGIPEEDLPLIWDRYFKSKEFHRRTAQGTGLGLSIVKNLLMLHGAPFGVDSRPGEGSTFWFELPTV